MFLLDTDHLGILQRSTSPEHAVLFDRMRRHSLDEFFASIVSFHEQVNGWNAYIRRDRGAVQTARGYAMFQRILADFASMNVLPFGATEAEKFGEMRTAGIRVGTMDLRIGVTALTHNMIILTRNTVDFSRIPNVQVEDWTTAGDPQA